LYTVLQFRFKNSFDLFHFFLLINNSINPFIYFAFSPPVSKLLARLRNCVKRNCPSKTLCCLPMFRRKYVINSSHLRNNTKYQVVNIHVIAGNLHGDNAEVCIVAPAQSSNKDRPLNQNVKLSSMSILIWFANGKSWYTHWRTNSLQIGILSNNFDTFFLGLRSCPLSETQYVQYSIFWNFF
jgi:hypothetical protein